jgi:UDP-GlcNAc3NAcA epimerase
MKITTIVGARPQFIKAATLSREFGKHPQVEEIIIHTGQHFDDNMSDVFFREMEIPAPKYKLAINGLGHGAMTGLMLKEIEEILLKEKPDYVLVYGDTNSTLAGALASAKLHIKLVHVEAGLRSFNMKMPEEINRILTDRVSNLLFCPTQQSVINLKNEGFDHFGCNIFLVGDVMQDAVIYYSKKAKEKSNIIKDLNLPDSGFILCTVHRAENTDDLSNLSQIIESLNELTRKIRVIVPLHPRTRKIIQDHKIKLAFEAIDPVGYFDMIQLLSHCALVITDSGGVQKEAYFNSKYCITIRPETEWIELVENGYNLIAGIDKKKIIDQTDSLLGKKFESDNSLYGGGTAAQKICSHLLSDFTDQKR